MKFAAHFLGLLALASPASQIYSLAWAPDGATIALGGYKETRLVDPAHEKNHRDALGQRRSRAVRRIFA